MTTLTDCPDLVLYEIFTHLDGFNSAARLARICRTIFSFWKGWEKCICRRLLQSAPRIVGQTNRRFIYNLGNEVVQLLDAQHERQTGLIHKRKRFAEMVAKRAGDLRTIRLISQQSQEIVKHGKNQDLDNNHYQIQWCVKRNIGRSRRRRLIFNCGRIELPAYEERNNFDEFYPMSIDIERAWKEHGMYIIQKGLYQLWMRSLLPKDPRSPFPSLEQDPAASNEMAHCLLQQRDENQVQLFGVVYLGNLHGYLTSVCGFPNMRRCVDFRALKGVTIRQRTGQALIETASKAACPNRLEGFDVILQPDEVCGESKLDEWEKLDMAFGWAFHPREI
ncbi:Protein of unknown function [Pyronema omphalodes CBS 100304]|uniref:F-box domain-containing protein n=1 Tax=Pyronema omphalodes (strain CBS 100304) TaxID=1076935 RepID=U4LRA9_PYROM|nr:Protein of unknown function [Pyronema omphalodes CBS 100304]